METPFMLIDKVQAFINQHLNSPITSLILKGSPFPEIDIHTLIEQIEAKKKCQEKLPTWFLQNNILYPNKLNIEQTSSEKTAAYKASIINGNSLLDLTGGFGVDDLYFSKYFKEVFHCEINSKLSQIVQHNAKQLNIQNLYFHEGDGLEFLKQTTQKFDCIYVDPSRRDDLKGKVFLLKDCLPNIPQNIDWMLQKASQIMIKISPLVDITSAIQELKCVQKIIVVALYNEVKELLIILENNYNGEIKIETVNLLKKSTEHFQFTYQHNYQSTFSEPLQYLYEPNSAILKSGGFDAVSELYQLNKLHQHSHLYTSSEKVDFPGRTFQVMQTMPYNKKELLKALPNKKANITTRNFKETVADIRKKTGIKDGGDDYLFFTTNLHQKQLVIFCKKVK